MNDLEELLSLRKEGNELLKEAAGLLTLSIEDIKRSKKIDREELTRLKKLVENLKFHKKELDDMFKDINFKDLKNEDDLNNLMAFSFIGDRFSNWIYKFTSETMGDLEYFKTRFEKNEQREDDRI